MPPQLTLTLLFFYSEVISVNGHATEVCQQSINKPNSRKKRLYDVEDIPVLYNLNELLWVAHVSVIDLTDKSESRRRKASTIPVALDKSVQNMRLIRSTKRNRSKQPLGRQQSDNANQLKKIHRVKKKNPNTFNTHSTRSIRMLQAGAEGVDNALLRPIKRIIRPVGNMVSFLLDPLGIGSSEEETIRSRKRRSPRSSSLSPPSAFSPMLPCSVLNDYNKSKCQEKKMQYRGDSEGKSNSESDSEESCENEKSCEGDKDGQKTYEYNDGIKKGHQSFNEKNKSYIRENERKQNENKTNKQVRGNYENYHDAKKQNNNNNNNNNNESSPAPHAKLKYLKTPSLSTTIKPYNNTGHNKLENYKIESQTDTSRLPGGAEGKQKIYANGSKNPTGKPQIKNVEQRSQKIYKTESRSTKDEPQSDEEDFLAHSSVPFKTLDTKKKGWNVYLTILVGNQYRDVLDIPKIIPQL